VVDIEYTDNRRCYKVVHNSWLRRQHIRLRSILSDGRLPGAGISYTYGTISRWYAAGNTVRARWSALAASASESKTPWKTT
jgi:hypothetical protein